MCTLPTLRSRVFVCCEQYKYARSYCWKWTHFTMGPNEQNQHFAELRQNIRLYIHLVVLLTCLPSLDGKLERFVTNKSGKRDCQTQTDYIAGTFSVYLALHIRKVKKRKNRFSVHRFERFTLHNLLWIYSVCILYKYQTTHVGRRFHGSSGDC